MDRLGIEFITGHGMDPADLVHLCADLKVDKVGLAFAPILSVPEDAPRWSLRDDAALFARVKSALTERGVTLMLAEGFMIHPAMDVAAAEADLDRFAELGAQRANILVMEPDKVRAAAQFAAFAAMTDTRGMIATMEFLPSLAVETAADALACIEASGADNAGVLLDSMHFFRTGVTLEELAAIPPARIGHVQICDVPRVSRHESYGMEAKCERMVPGTGELHLREFIAALPPGIPLGLEVPQSSLGLAGMPDRERIAALVSATRSFATGLL